MADAVFNGHTGFCSRRPRALLTHLSLPSPKATLLLLSQIQELLRCTEEDIA
jgi:hypothetical protein